MLIHLQVLTHAAPGKLPPLLELLTRELIPLLQSQGWQLVGCFTSRTGPINTIIALWELEDMEHFRRAYRGCAVHPAFPDLRARLDACVQKETLTFLERTL